MGWLLNLLRREFSKPHAKPAANRDLTSDALKDEDTLIIQIRFKIHTPEGIGPM